MSDEQASEERKRENRRRLLGDGPAEHGGGYRPDDRAGYVANAGCCLGEAALSFGIACLAFLGIPLYLWL